MRNLLKDLIQKYLRSKETKDLTTKSGTLKAKVLYPEIIFVQRAPVKEVLEERKIKSLKREV